MKQIAALLMFLDALSFLCQTERTSNEAQRMKAKNFTRATWNDSESKQTKSSIGDHVTNENHLIKWGLI